MRYRPTPTSTTAVTLSVCLLSALDLPSQIGVSSADEHADWPSIAIAPNDDLWVAWTAYDGKGADSIRARRRTEGEWEEAATVSHRAGDYLKTALAVQPRGRVWIARAAQVDGNFDIYARNWHEGRWDPVVRLTTDPRPDLHHRLATDSKGRLHLVWQSFRTGDANIFRKTHDGNRWSSPVAVTTHESND